MALDSVDLTIVVPVLNEESRLDGCLTGLVAVLAALPMPARLVVVDNGSTDGSAALVTGWQRRSARQGRRGAHRRARLVLGVHRLLRRGPGHRHGGAGAGAGPAAERHQCRRG